jgi:hypothetical protein
MGFPKLPIVVPQDIPNNTSILSHMVCPKFNSQVYQLKKWAKEEHVCFYLVCPKFNSQLHKLKKWANGEHICFYFVIMIQRGVFIGEGPMFQKQLMMGQSMCILKKRKEKRCECTHEQINMNHNMFILGVRFLFSQFLLVQSCHNRTNMQKHNGN